MSKRGALSLYVLAFAIVVLMVMRIERLYSQRTARQEFTITLQYRLLDDQGVERTTWTTTVASRLDGGQYRKVQSKHSTIIRITDPVRKLSLTLDPILKHKSSIPLNDVQLQTLKSRLRYSGENCTNAVGQNTLYLGTAKLGNLEVAAFGSDYDRVLRRYLHISHLAPEMNCFKVFGDDVWKDEAGKITGRTLEEAISFQIGTPDPALFSIGDDFLEVKPSELRQASD